MGLGTSTARCWRWASRGRTTVSRTIIAGVWVAFFQECQQQSCEQAGVITGDGKEEILDEAMCEVRILPPVSPSDDTWIVHTFAG